MCLKEKFSWRWKSLTAQSHCNPGFPDDKLKLIVVSCSFSVEHVDFSVPTGQNLLVGQLKFFKHKRLAMGTSAVCTLRNSGWFLSVVVYQELTGEGTFVCTQAWFPLMIQHFVARGH
uniref:Phenylalanine--tRNA ligase beta subunit n=1 Tax=Anthurium amnicola TaxID=1678845 RepID=A0A1D1Z1Q2_9ARAE